MAKLFKIVQTKSSTYGREKREYTQIGTLTELVDAYSYTLEKGQSWQHEQGNKKINRNPKSIKTLVSNLYNAENNSAANGYSGSYFENVEVTPEDKSNYKAA